MAVQMTLPLSEVFLFFLILFLRLRLSVLPCVTASHFALLFCCIFTIGLLHRPISASLLSDVRWLVFPSLCLDPSPFCLFQAAWFPLIFQTKRRCRDKNTPCCRYELISIFIMPPSPSLSDSSSTSSIPHLVTNTFSGCCLKHLNSCSASDVLPNPENIPYNFHTLKPYSCSYLKKKSASGGFTRFKNLFSDCLVWCNYVTCVMELKQLLLHHQGFCSGNF